MRNKSKESDAFKEKIRRQEVILNAVKDLVPTGLQKLEKKLMHQLSCSAFTLANTGNPPQLSHQKRHTITANIADIANKANIARFANIHISRIWPAFI